MDPQITLLLGTVGAILVISSIIGAILAKRVTSEGARKTVANLNARIRSWWVMSAIFCATMLLGQLFTTVLFACLSFLALREFITLNKTERADHEVLFWVFFVILPLHYFLVGIRWYGLFTIFIPVYAFVFIPFRRVLAGETKGFLNSTAKIQWALLVCVYAVSHMPMLLALIATVLFAAYLANDPRRLAPEDPQALVEAMCLPSVRIVSLTVTEKGYHHEPATGALRRDDTNRVSNADPYLQAEWRPTPAWLLNAGVRRSRVSFRSTDGFVTPTNPDDSGSARYAATLPVLGVSYAVSDALRVYATAGRGFETPTLNELAYRPNGATGLNFALQAATSRSLELGLKGRLAGGGAWTLAAYETRTAREIVTQTNLGGRATFQNAGATRRQGVEASASLPLGATLQLQLAATWLDARYRDGFLTCTATPCATATSAVAAGNRLPGVARSAGSAALQWQPAGGWRLGLEGRALSRVWVNDLNTDAAAGHALLAASAGHQLTHGAWTLDTLLRVDNLAGRRTSGSVIVNDGNGRFFEPAPGRTWLASVSLGHRF